MPPTSDSHPVPRIQLAMPPAYAGLLDALRAAAAYWRGTVAHWVLPVAAVALVNLLAVLFLGGASITTAQMQMLVVAGPLGPEIDSAQLPRVVAGPLAVGIVSIVARWFLVANAIAGLRGREITTAWVVGSGLRSFVADMLVAMVAVMAVTTALMVGPLGAVVLLLLLPAAVYVGLRLQFWTLAIFDGRSVVGGADTSWRLTRRAVLRVLGWSLAVGAIGLLFSIGLTILDVVATSLPAVSAVLGAIVETGLMAFTVVVTAVLYESQRDRSAAVPAVVWTPPVEEPRGPYDPPPPPPRPGPPGPPTFPG